MTKKNILVASSALGGALLILDRIGAYNLCGRYSVGSCPFVVHGIIIIFFPVFPLLVLSAIVYFLREEVFRVWVKFAYVWVPLTVVMILVAPEYGNALLPIEKGTVAVFFSLVFVIVSIIIMIAKSISLRK